MCSGCSGVLIQAGSIPFQGVCRVADGEAMGMLQINKGVVEQNNKADFNYRNELGAIYFFCKSKLLKWS